MYLISKSRYLNSKTFQNYRWRTFNAFYSRKGVKSNSKNIRGPRNVSRYKINYKIKVPFTKEIAPLRNVRWSQLKNHYDICKIVFFFVRLMAKFLLFLSKVGRFWLMLENHRKWTGQKLLLDLLLKTSMKQTQCLYF